MLKNKENSISHEITESDGSPQAFVAAWEEAGVFRPKLVELPLNVITPSPLNPRKNFDAEGLKELAVSVKLHGVQQPIVVRPTRGAGWTHDSPELSQYWVVMGERRFRAAQMAGLATIPALVRCDITDDAHHIELALIENLHRRDIDAIEEAQAFEELRKLGYTQQGIADMVNRSQAAVANTLRLLQLPETVQAKVQTGVLPPTSARALLKYAPLPSLANAMAEIAIEKKIPSAELEKSKLSTPMRIELVSRGELLRLDDAKFNARDKCVPCPHNARIEGEYAFYCANHACYKALNREWQVAQDAREEAARLKAANSGGEPIQDIGKRRRIDEEGEAAGCSEQCACRGLGRSWDGSLVPVCNEPGKYQALLNKVTIAKRNALRAEFAAIEAGFWADLDIGGFENPLVKRTLVFMAWNLLSRESSDTKLEVLANFPLPDSVRAILTKPQWNVQWAEAMGALGEVSALTLLRFCARVIVRAEMRYKVEMKTPTLSETQYLWNGLLAEPRADVMEAESEFLGDEEGEEDDSLWRCSGCREAIPMDAVGTPPVQMEWFDKSKNETDSVQWVKLESGVVLIGRESVIKEGDDYHELNAVYCAACAPGVMCVGTAAARKKRPVKLTEETAAIGRNRICAANARPCCRPRQSARKSTSGKGKWRL